MLSWTLRLKSAPSAVDADPTGGASQSQSLSSSPYKSPRGRSKPLSSKGSLSSLFSKSKRDESSKVIDPADLVDDVESDLYPVYDPSNPHHSPLSLQRRESSPSPARSASRSRKGSLRKVGSRSSLQPSKNILETLAFKMKAATEYFHRGPSSSQSSDESRHSKASSTRSLSPKKSVRFRSGTFSNESAASSSPINVPTKAMPCLPQLKLPSGDFLRDITNETLQVPIPMSRPQDTPVLKGKRDSDYFFPFPTEIDQKLDYLKGQRGEAQPLPLIDLKQRNSEQENPFNDAAAISPSQEHSPVTAQSPDADGLSGPVSPDFPRESVEEEWSKFSPSKPPDDNIHYFRAGSESNVTNPFCDSIASFEEVAVPHSTPESTKAEITMTAVPSAWGLESRVSGSLGRMGPGCDHDSNHSDSSDDTIARLHRPSKPTHEDIRLQFRGRRFKAGPSNKTHTTNLEVNVDHQITPSPAHPTKLATDIYKLPSSPAELDFVPDGAVSPLNLTSTRSSTTRARTRRAFRFSNQTPPRAPPADVGPVKIGWEGHILPPHSYANPKAFEGKTPSPVAIPLPLSVHPKPQITSKQRDQHGWTPFDEPSFPAAFVRSRDVHDMLRQPGGMSQVWRLLDLPTVTGPEEDTRALTAGAIKKMLQICVYLCAAEETTSPLFDHRFEHRNSMSELFSPSLSDNLNPFTPLNGQSRHPDEISTADDSSLLAESPSLKRSPRKYSVEVSKIHDSSASTDESGSDMSGSQCKSHNSSCRCTETARTSFEPGIEEAPAAISTEGESGEAHLQTPTKSLGARSSVSPFKVGSLETTPKQSDFMQRQFRLPIRERSRATTDSGESDEEQYIKGII